MTTDVVDLEVGFLDRLTRDQAALDAQMGRRAALFVRHLPAVFRLFHRLSFEMDLPPQLRRFSSSIAVYIAEPQDYLGEACRGALGLVDDAWLAFSAFGILADRVQPEVLARHWLSEIPIAEVEDLARNVDVLRPSVPARVLHMLEEYLETPSSAPC